MTRTITDHIDHPELFSVDGLNKIEKALTGFNEDQLEAFDYMVDVDLLEKECDILDAIEDIGNCIIWDNCSDIIDVAERYYEICYGDDIIGDHLLPFINFEAYGDSLSEDRWFIFTSRGNCVDIPC